MRDADHLLQEKYAGQVTADYQKDVQRLEKGEPLGYLIGEVPFIHATIDVSLRPLLPRTETEYWVSHIIDTLKNNNSNKTIRILDLFAGSGCIGVAILKDVLQTEVVFGEKDPTLLEQIAINIERNAIATERTHIVQTDVFSEIVGTFDYIFANPPYIPLAHKTQLDSSVTDYEPHQALFAEDNGLALIKQTIDEAPRYLQPPGRLYIEFDASQKDQLATYVYGNTTWTDYQIMNDQYQRPRVLCLEKSTS